MVAADAAAEQVVSVENIVKPHTRIITEEELAKHNSAKDCWLAINGKVYDVTTWLSKHPGGGLVLVNCSGRDATDAFLAYHKPPARKYLRAFEIGELATKDAELDPLTKDYREMLAELETSELMRARAGYYARHCLLVLMFLVAAVVLVRLSHHPVALAVSSFCLALFWQQCAFIGHDSGHNGIFQDNKADSILGVIAGDLLTGISIGWWKRTHNNHHVVCNSVDHDPDIQHVPFIAITTKFFNSVHSFYKGHEMPFDSFARCMVSCQHYTFYILMTVARINLWAQSVGTMIYTEDVKLRTAECVALSVHWLWLGALLSYVPTWSGKAAYLAFACAVSGILHVQICLSHKSMHTYLGLPEDGSWVKMQMATTMDVACPRWMDWFHGGLQNQIEHHLFPRVPRHNLRHLTPRVRELCARYNVPYKSVSFFHANVILMRSLRSVALAARAAECSSASKHAVANSPLWDALNLQG
eukprot:jgi/Chlat1/1794/Chrsp135S02136